MTDTTTDLIQRYATEIQRIIDAGANADHTWVGLLTAFMQEYAGDHVPAFADLHAFLDLASFRDHLSVTVANTDGSLTARIEGPVLAADDDPAVGIDLFDGAPYVLRETSGIAWAPVRSATLSRDGQTIATHLEAQQTEASLRRGLADITAGRTVDLGTFAQPATAPSAAQRGDSGHGDGGEAVQAALAVLRDEGADSEGGWHSWRCFDRECYPEPCDCTEQVTRAAIAAAEPHIRAEIADEIEQHYLGADFGRNPTTGADSPDASLHDAYDEALNLAARIARQEQP